jgi:hypothetical protein
VDHARPRQIAAIAQKSNGIEIYGELGRHGRDGPILVS